MTTKQKKNALRRELSPDQLRTARGLERLTAAALAQVRGGATILLPAFSEVKTRASSTMLEEITIAHEDLVRTQ